MNWAACHLASGEEPKELYRLEGICRQKGRDEERASSSSFGRWRGDYVEMISLCHPGNARPTGQVKTTFGEVIIVLGLGIRYWCVAMALVQLTSFGAYCLFFQYKKRPDHNQSDFRST